MGSHLAISRDVAGQSLVFHHGGIECLQVARQRVIHGGGAETLERLRSRVWVGELRAFHDLVGGDVGVDCFLATAERSGQQVNPKRLVRLFGHVLGRSCPKIVSGDRGDVTEGLSVSLGFVKRPL